MTKKRPSNLGFKLLLAAVCAGLLLFWVVMDWPCVFREVTGLPCVSCGMSRAWVSALRLDLKAAFTYHPMFWSVPILVVFAFFDGKPLKSERLNRLVLTLILGGLPVCYLFRLIGYLRGTIIF